MSSAVQRRNVSEAYRHLASSNDAPLDYQLVEIRHVLAQALESLDAFKQQLEVDDEDLDILMRQPIAHEEATLGEEEHAEIRGIQEFIKCHRPITSAIRRFPAEIIAEILLHARPGWRQLEEYPIVHDTNCGPWSYSRVSYLWRGVSLSLPQIWSDLTVDELTATECRTRLNVLKLWLKRSGNKTLRIVGNIQGEAIIPQYEDMMRMLAAENHRWDIFMWNVALLRRKSAPAEGDEAFCRQETLAAEIWDGPADQDILRPNLRMYYLGGSDVDSDPFRLLRCAPNLEALSLGIEIQDRFLPDNTMVFTNIQRLEVDFTSFDLIQYLTLPFLNALVVTTFSFRVVAEFLRRSQCPLETLSIRDPVPLDARMVQVLEVVPTVKELLLSWTQECTPGSAPLDHETILEKLTVKEGRPLLLPLLTTFSMDVDNDTDLDALLDMLESRCTEMEDQPLTDVTFTCDDLDPGLPLLRMRGGLAGLKFRHGLKGTILRHGVHCELELSFLDRRRRSLLRCPRRTDVAENGNSIGINLESADDSDPED
ncbi:uncharacterized protein EV420DRAFT_741481 [Desarmillaria tabescens]|uniref:F-box domain-containing protein n=1 Tax=Armillaria tabescens TaxID=1929756 RepID=A0AA39JXV1_ARMTA|nr:uncharacterized protein EV420DRAFT_741481 [Desarmillaria tabescens]KAK0450582.1 hypothetical protein EV420DRAFT_741481 [Desarmillaria tabescens]